MGLEEAMRAAISVVKILLSERFEASPVFAVRKQLLSLILSRVLLGVCMLFD